MVTKRQHWRNGLRSLDEMQNEFAGALVRGTYAYPSRFKIEWSPRPVDTLPLEGELSTRQDLSDRASYVQRTWPSFCLKRGDASTLTISPAYGELRWITGISGSR